MKKYDLLSMTEEELCLMSEELGEKAFRGRQIFEWLNKKHVYDINEFSNISKTFREKLIETSVINSVSIAQKLVSKQDETIKYLFALGNDTIIEGVLMRYTYGLAACVSTQAGCRMGCKFCASAIGGMERNLTTGEMLSEVYTMDRDLGEKVSRVILMGSGEPLDNYDNVLKFIRIISSPEGYGLSGRHITLSTCGIIDKIYELAEEELQITLAVSLHAPNDNIRKKIMPIATKNPIDKLMAACKYYFDRTKRRITFEYALIKGVNDSEDCALELSNRLKGMAAHVNLIPVNRVSEHDFQKSSDSDIRRFAAILKDRGIEVTIRRELGSDINAACGQLRRRYLETKK